MKKCVLYLFCVVCMVICLATGVSAARGTPYAVTGGNIYFDADTGDITECDSSVTTANIPSEIDGVSITSIGAFAFEYCYYLTSLTIPNSIISIENFAFRSCSSLTNVTIPNSVTSIGAYAFENCSSLTSVTMPNSIVDIGTGAFQDCSSLINATIPNSVTSIGESVFHGCSSLRSIAIPNSLTSTGRYTFSHCSNLKNVTIPDSVTSIGIYTFLNCSSLTNVIIPNSIISIEALAFCGCSGLTNITIPDSVTSIGDYAFQWCSCLKNITIPNSVTSIGEEVFDCCNSLTHIYYAGTEAKWNEIGGHAYVPSSTIIYYESEPPSFPAPIPIEATVPSNQYCIHVVDENGKPLKGATVYWEDSAETLTDDTDNNGDVYFSTLTLGIPKIDVSLSGYISWTNRNSNWSKSDKRYSEVILYDEAHGVYKLASAYYSNVGNETSWHNLLTTTKKLNLKNDGNLVGDLDFGNFYLTCTACTTQGIDRYELWQNDKQISQCPDGRFPRLSVTSFSKGGGCFVRVIASDETATDTNINLEFAQNTVQKETGISILKDKIGITVADDVPFLGGSTFNVGDVGILPVEIKVTEDKFYIGFNSKIWSSSDSSSAQTQGKFDKFKKSLQSVMKANATLGKRDTDLMNALMKMEPDFALPGGRVKINVIGYAEANWGSSAAIGELYIVCKATTPTFGFTTWVVVVPVTVQVSGSAELKAGAKISYNWESSTFSGEFPLTLTLGLDAFGGVGVGKVTGVGAYGSANVAFGMQVFLSPFLKSVDLTGDLGIKAYVGPFEYQRSFAHNTWHLYTANNVQNAKLQDVDTKAVLYASFYDASQYKRHDLGYLAEESEWMGDVASLLEASEQTEQASLLSDTYRNAQPVMIATDNALYAAFVRADTGSRQRYVVLTKFNGSSWQEPVRVDANAVLDSAPALCTDGNTVYLAYARTTENPGDSLLSYALKQEIVVGSINPDALSFTEQSTFSGLNPDSSFVSMPQLSAANGRMILAWADSAVSDDNSVLRPVSSVIRYATCSDGAWGNATDMGTVNAPVDSITIGERNASPAIACLLDENSERNLYLLAASGQERIAENVLGTVAYARLPGTDRVSFLWNGENVLTSSDGNSAEVPGISGEYAVSGNNIYYSAATDGGANLTVLQYHVESGTWGLPIQLTNGKRYLENLSVASLNATDYVMGMYTAATITENAVEDAKNLVWSAIKPVSDLRLDSIDYDAENIKTGESLPVTLAVINAGEHTVNRIAVTLNNSAVKTQECSLKPGESLDIEVAVPVAESLSECLFAVAEPEKDDYSPDNNAGTVKIGYADAAIELEYQQIGTKKALMASVTNEGIEAASGNIVFYDADGSSVAESAFTDLASGDTTIAVYELDESFAGINDGDVSARVTLEQEELYTYNNADTLHIMEAESNPEKTEIVSAVANGERGLSTDIACESELAATAYCAFYNGDGKMLSVEIRPLSTGRNSLTFTARDQAASKAKIFVLDNQMIPQCASNAVEIT